jgi:hypothetical protein
VFFFEHIRFAPEKKHIGHIPRYLNWHLTRTWKRDAIRAALRDVIALPAISKPLKLQPQEKKMIHGFVAVTYLQTLAKELALQRIHNNEIFLLLVEMTPIFWKFGFEPCALLMNEAPPRR